MKNLWYYSGLLFVLAILGISAEQTVAPNQEIVIQFTDAKVSLDETQETLDRIKEQLETIAVSNIHLQRQGNGTLKITYYSDIDVAKIKKILLKGQSLRHTSTLLAKGDSKFPIEDDKTIYQIGVQKIQDVEDLAGTTSGVLESKSETIRFSNPNVYAAVHTSIVKQISNIECSAYTIYSDEALVFNNTDYKIPEVRAGPLA